VTKAADTPRNRHQGRALALIEAVQPEAEFTREEVLPEASRWIDAAADFEAPSEAWGVLRPDLERRRVYVEHFSQPPSERSLASAALKAVSGLDRWLSQPPTARPPRPPLSLVLSDGFPRKALARLCCAKPAPWAGVYRLTCGFELLLVDAKRVTAVPGAAFLRLLHSPKAGRADRLKAVFEDPELSAATKRALQELVMQKDELFAPAERDLTYAEVLAKGRQEGRHDELLDLARSCAPPEVIAELEQIDDLDALRARVRALFER